MNLIQELLKNFDRISTLKVPVTAIPIGRHVPFQVLQIHQRASLRSTVWAAAGLLCG